MRALIHIINTFIYNIILYTQTHTHTMATNVTHNLIGIWYASFDSWTMCGDGDGGAVYTMVLCTCNTPVMIVQKLKMANETIPNCYCCP